MTFYEGLLLMMAASAMTSLCLIAIRLGAMLLELRRLNTLLEAEKRAARYERLFERREP